MSETSGNEHTPAGASERFDSDADLPAGATGAGNGAGGNGAGFNGAPQDADMRRVSEVPLELSVEIGRTQMTVGETLDLRAGSIVTLDRLAGEPVDLLVNGTPIARGEVVVVDEQFGLRVTEILEGDPTEPAVATEEGATGEDAAGQGATAGAPQAQEAQAAEVQA